MKVLNLTLLHCFYVLISFKSFASNNNIGLNSYCGVKDDRLINQKLNSSKTNISINKSKKMVQKFCKYTYFKRNKYIRKNKKKFNSKYL